jgi:chromosome segregation ATPase
MGAVMAELSKTARASMVKKVEKSEEESTEKAIQAIRSDLAAGIWPNCERMRKLLAAYDAGEKAYESLDGQYDALDGTLGRANSDLKDLKETNDNLEATIVHLQDEMHVLRNRIAVLTAAVDPAGILAEPVVMEGDNA